MGESTDVIGRDLDPEGPVPTEHRRPRGWERRALENEAQRVETLSLLRQMTEHLGGLLTTTRAAPRADVLAQMTQVIPQSGVLVRQWSNLAQAVTVSNYGGCVLTVTTQGSQSQAPPVGSGVALVPGGIERTVALRGNSIAIYGLPGTPVEFVAWARPRPPHSAPCAWGPCDGVLVPGGTQASQTVLLTQETFTRLVIVQNVSAVAGGSLQVTINGVTPSGYVYPILVGLAVTAVGATPLRVGPALNSSPNAVANDVVPREVQIVATAVAAVTYGLDFVGGR